ncbi:hypothetical protein [Acidimangrovimonas pyrenivorans]|uniref:Uncharacterized protein n=1 Tax=Acidimangrovimonas pyrenivorans TaxID=2030798 RepID=A0ABV7ALT3_9RHOB
MTTEPQTTETPDEDIPVTAEEQRARASGANKTLALLLVGGALVMLVAAFGVAILVTHGGY